MKKFLGKLAILTIFGATILANGCKKDVEVAINPGEEFAFLKDFNQVRLKEFPAELLPRIKQDMVDRQDLILATRLENTYDFETGKLLPKALQYLNSFSQDKNSKTNMVWTGYWVSDNARTTLWGEPVPNAAGTVVLGSGPPHWLVAFGIVNSPTTYPKTPWQGSNTVSYNGYINGSITTWFGLTGVNTAVWTPWNTDRIESCFFWAGSSIACYTYYRAFLSNNTWTPWVANGAYCATQGSGHAIMKIELQIASVENCS